jgi:hypothetical protein
MQAEEIGQRVIDFIIEHCHDNVEVVSCKEKQCEHYNDACLTVYKGNAQEQLGTFVQRTFLDPLAAAAKDKYTKNKTDN